MRTIYISPKGVELDFMETFVGEKDGKDVLVKPSDWYLVDGAPADEFLRSVGVTITEPEPPKEYTEEQQIVIAELRAKDAKAFGKDPVAASEYREHISASNPGYYAWIVQTYATFQAKMDGQEIPWPVYDSTAAPVAVDTPAGDSTMPSDAPVAADTQPAPEPTPEPVSAAESPSVVEEAPVPAAEPANLTGKQVQNVVVAKRADASGYDMTWDAVEGATYYELSYTSASLGEWKLHTPIETNSLFVPVDMLPPDETTYGVIAANELGRAKFADGKDAFSPDATF